MIMVDVLVLGDVTVRDECVSKLRLAGFRHHPWGQFAPLDLLYPRRTTSLMTNGQKNILVVGDWIID